MPSVPNLPRQIGRYEVLGRLATGGTAEVLLVRPAEPGATPSPLVLKRVLPHLAAHGEVVAMASREARLLVRLSHPNIVRAIEVGGDASPPCVVLEYLPGESLAGVSRRLVKLRSRFEPRLAAYVVAEACAGLHAAHEVRGEDGRPIGLVHRDVSPQNVLVGYDGGVHVIDFGLAVGAVEAAGEERGPLRGTPAYMAPEQVQGRAVDRRADVFAAGVLLFELLTARRLYARAGAAQSLVAIVEDPVPDPQSVTPDLEDGLVALCRRALAKEPSLRPATAAEMREALLACAPEREGALLRDSLAALMLHAFPERARAKAELVRRAQAGEAVTVLPEAETDTSIEIPGWSLPGGS